MNSNHLSESDRMAKDCVAAFKPLADAAQKILDDNAMNRILADIEATPAQAPRVEAVMTEVIQSVRNRVGPGHTVQMTMRMRWINGQAMPRTAFAVTIVKCDENNDGISSVGCIECDDAYEAGREAIRLWTEEQYRQTVENRVAREMALAAQIDISLGFADNGEATAGTLPLLRLGPGGSFVREVRP